MHQAQWSPERPLPPPVSLASQSHHEKPPEVTCTSRGNPGFPASTRESPRPPTCAVGFNRILCNLLFVVITACGFFFFFFLWIFLLFGCSLFMWVCRKIQKLSWHDDHHLPRIPIGELCQVPIVDMNFKDSPSPHLFLAFELRGWVTWR